MKKLLFAVVVALLFPSFLLAEGATASNSARKGEDMKIRIEVQSESGKHTLFATLSDNSSAAAFYNLLESGELKLKMKDYASFEKVGRLPSELPRNDEQITTSAGDIILYQGNQITIYYDTNLWSFTRLGKIDDIDEKQLKAILGKGSITAIFSKEVKAK